MISSEDRDKISSLMGTYLLQGYTLLDEYCCICQTPLMRKKLEQSFCLYCNRIKSNNNHNDNNGKSSPQTETMPITISDNDHQNSRMIICSNNKNYDEYEESKRKIRKKLLSTIENYTNKLNMMSSTIQYDHDQIQLDRINSIIYTIDKLADIYNKI